METKKRIWVGVIFIMVLTVGLSGCTSDEADIKIISVDIDKFEHYPYNTYNVTINLKNIGDKETKVQIYLGLQDWNESMNDWYAAGAEDIDTVYIEAGYTTAKVMSVTDRQHPKNRIYIQAFKRVGSDWCLSDDYEKII